MSRPTRRFIEIGANLLDKMFTGKHHGKKMHAPDLSLVLERAWKHGVESIIITASNLRDAHRAVELCRRHNAAHPVGTACRLHCTVGVHPTNTLRELEGYPDSISAEDRAAAAAAAASAPASAGGASGGAGAAGCTTGEEGCGNRAASAAHESSDDEEDLAALTASIGAASLSSGAGVAAGGSGAAAGAGHHRPHHGHGHGHGHGAHYVKPSSKAAYIAAMDALIAEGKRDGVVVAVGECGLDYDRLFFSPKDVQLRHLAFHFDLAAKHGLPLFLHDRNTGGDFLRIMREHRHRVPGGVVHSFTGTADEAKAYLDLGLELGINGCSLKTEENLAVVRGLPIDRLMLETDAPWCEIKRAHASFPHVTTPFKAVKREKYNPYPSPAAPAAAGTAPAAASPSAPGAGAGSSAAGGPAGAARGAYGSRGGGAAGGSGARGGKPTPAAAAPAAAGAAASGEVPLVQGRCEPCQIVQVAEVVAALHGISVDELAAKAHAATMALFFPRASA